MSPFVHSIIVCISALMVCPCSHFTLPQVPGGDLKGVHYLKSLADGEGLLKGMASTLAAGGQVPCAHAQLS